MSGKVERRKSAAQYRDRSARLAALAACVLTLLTVVGCGGGDGGESSAPSTGPSAGTQVQELVDHINTAFAEKPADVAAFFARIYAVEPRHAQALGEISDMLQASTELRHAVLETFGQPLGENIAPTMEIKARAEGGDPPKIVLVDEKGEEKVSEPVLIGGQWMLTLDALGEPFKQQLTQPRAPEISEAAQRMAPAFRSVAAKVRSGEISEMTGVAVELETALTAALGESSAQ